MRAAKFRHHRFKVNPGKKGHRQASMDCEICINFVYARGSFERKSHHCYDIAIINAKKLSRDLVFRAIFARFLSGRSRRRYQPRIERSKGSKTALAFADRLICDDATRPKPCPKTSSVCPPIWAVGCVPNSYPHYRRHRNIFIILITTFEFIAYVHVCRRTWCHDALSVCAIAAKDRDQRLSKGYINAST